MHKHELNPQQKRQTKGITHFNQLQTIFQYLLTHTATASMVSDVTGIPQKCICRYKRDLEKEGRLWETVKAKCKKTGCKAWYLTTDENKATIPSFQLNLF